MLQNQFDYKYKLSTLIKDGNGESNRSEKTTEGRPRQRRLDVVKKRPGGVETGSEREFGFSLKFEANWF